MKNNLIDSKDVITISISCLLIIIYILEFENKYLHHQLIMAKREIGELMIKIFVNESLLEDIELEKMELERKLS